MRIAIKKRSRLRGSAQSVENLRVVKGPQPLEAKPEKNSKKWRLATSSKVLRLVKRVLAQPTDGAYPILRDVFPGGAGSYAVIGIAQLGIVYIAAGAFVFFHRCVLLFLPCYSPK